MMRRNGLVGGFFFCACVWFEQVEPSQSVGSAVIRMYNVSVSDSVSGSEHWIWISVRVFFVTTYNREG